MATQPLVKTTIASEFDAKYCYVATVETPEFVVDAAVTYTNKVYTPVTRVGETAHNVSSGTNTVRAAIPSAVSPGANFVAVIRYYNESTSTVAMLLSGKTAWNQANGFYIGQKTNADTLEINGGSSSGYPTIAATGSGLIGTAHTLVAEFVGTDVNLSMDGATLGSVTIGAANGSWPSGLGIGNFSGAGAGSVPARSVMMAAILGSKGSKTLNELSADPYLIFDGGDTITANLGTATASGFAAAIAVSVTIACSLGGATASGNQALISTGSNVTINTTLGTATASGHSASVASSGTATIMTDVFKNNTGTVLSSTLIPKLVALKLSDMTLAASWTNQTTNGSGVLSLTGAMTAATDYLLVVSSTDGASVGVKKYTAT